MSNLIPVGRKAASMAVKYGPQAKLAWETAGKAAAEQVKIRRARAANRRRAFEKARTITEGTVLRQLHGDQVIWVVYAADEPVTAYPLPDVELHELTRHARLDDRMTPEEFDESRARARAKRAASLVRRPRYGGNMADEVQQAAIEAAQRVVDDVSSWEYSAERDTIAERLDAGLREAQVSVDDEERTRILVAINEMKDEESSPPQVRSARPVS